MLPPIPNDPEDQVSMEDKPSEDLCKMAVLSKRGYKFKGDDDWRNRSVKLHDANEEIARRSFRFGHVEMGQSSSNEDFVLSKINSINKMMEDNFRIMNARLSLIEKDNMEIKVCVSKLEERHRVTSDKNLHNENEGSRVQTHFEIDANVEIASQDEDIYVKWYPGNVLNTDMRNGVEMVKVEYSTRFRDKNKRTKKLQMKVHPAQSVKPSQEDRAKKGKAVVGKKRRTAGPPEDGVGKMAKEIEVQQAQSVKPSQGDHAKKCIKFGKTVVGKKRKATAPPVDNLAFLQREEKRPIGPRNHPIPVTPEVILPTDPFVTPEFPRFSRLGYWMGQRGIHCVPLYINGREKEKDFFEYMDDAENNLKEEHIDAAFAMLNSKGIEQSTWFCNKGLPEACFVPVQFLESVGYSYESLKKPPKKRIQMLKGDVGEVVRGLKTPRKIWLEDVDVVYGVVHERKSDHFIGVEIHLMDNTIKLFHCGLRQKGIRVENTPLIRKLAVLIPAIKLELMGEEINYKDIVPFQVKKAEGLPKTRFPFNYGIFVVKILECKSLGLKNMTNINDDNAMDLRSKLCCEIFDQFMDKNFHEGCRK
ncbi:hypothetical protein Bca52824_035625 [Brassica carinata]|uniref:Ubiquitin-like protease family profile domain-containing protein n=1 Tax=Brassica carinata TaxID=52824 RepID=A0A8X7S112_BRACI|nr:hypothetical protein Bca52824_035625 [Brassica carinata]